VEGTDMTFIDEAFEEFSFEEETAIVIALELAIAYCDEHPSLGRRSLPYLKRALKKSYVDFT
jgi:hypothetical protein